MANLHVCVNVYSVSAWIIVKLIILLGLLLGHLLFIILNVGSGGTRFCIDMHFKCSPGERFASHDDIFYSRGSSVLVDCISVLVRI